MGTLNLPVHSYELRSRSTSPARLVNCYPELMPPGGRTPVMVTRSPGIASWITVGTGPIAGMYAAQINFDSGRLNDLYVVSGSDLYKVHYDGGTVTDSSSYTVSASLGNVGTPSRVDIASNDGEGGVKGNLVVVNEPNGYYYDGATFGQIVDDDFVSRGAGDVEYIDRFLIFREPNSQRFFAADLESATEFDALQFAECDSASDNLVGMITDHGQVVNFGELTAEIWENTGTTGFPFERNINGTIEKGCLNADTVSKQDNSIYWTADDKTVRRLDGINPVRVSTHSIEQKIADATASSATAFTYNQDGHFFYVLSFLEGTYVLDVTTGEWSERQTYAEDRWRPQHHAEFQGLQLVGDGKSNKIGFLDPNTYTDFGDVQRMEWTYQPVYAKQQRAFHNRFEVVMETGVGLTLGQGSDPKIMLEYSDDGGKVWKRMPDKTIGKKGESDVRVYWTNLGSSRQRVYRCAVSDPIAITITDTVVEVDGGRL